MNYAYLRVSTDRQDVENQKLGIVNYAKSTNLKVDAFIEDIVSGTKDWRKRDLGKIIREAKEGDTIVFAEVSRIARSTLQCLQVLEICADKKLVVHVAKQNMRFDNSLNSKIIATTLSLAAEIERSFISSRTKEALQRAKAEGRILGRPKGSTSINAKLASCHIEVETMLEKGLTYTSIGKMFEVDRKTVASYVKQHLPKLVKNKPVKEIKAKSKKATTKKRRKKVTS